MKRTSRSVACSYCIICSASGTGFVFDPSLPVTRRVASKRRAPSAATAANDRSTHRSAPCLPLRHAVRTRSVLTLRSELHHSASAEKGSVCDYSRLWKWAELQECEGIDSFGILSRSPSGRHDEDDTNSGSRHRDNDDVGDDDEGMRGLFATDGSHFEAGDYLFAIPFTATLLIRDGDCVDDTSGFTCLDTDVLDGYAFWRNFWAKVGSGNLYRPYLDALPQRNGPHFDATPDFWPEHDVRELQIPALIDETLRRKRDIEQIVRHHNEQQRLESNESSRLSAEDLQWAVWVVRTRGFTTLQVRQECSDTPEGDVTRSDDDKLCDDTSSGEQVRTRTFLIPIIDMANHSDRPNAELEVVEVPGGSYEESFFALRALSTIVSGDEVTLQYGTGYETSIDLLSKYGFVPSNGAAGDPNLDWELVNPQWTTTLDDDRESLAKMAWGNSMRTVLTLRVALKELKRQQLGD